MSKIYKSAMGKPVDMDMLRLSNEEVIAVGNMRTNARGDQLGKGGKVVRSRSEIMREYHKLNTPVAEDLPISTSVNAAPPEDLIEEVEDLAPKTKLVTPIAEDTPVATSAPSVSTYTKPRGSFAEAVAEQTEVKQELLTPAGSKNQGVKRI
jgi:hypothetical protein